MKFGIPSAPAPDFCLFALARYQHLAIYKPAYDLPAHLAKLVAGFSRYHKHTLGTEMREGSRAVWMQVLRANKAGHAKQRRDALLVVWDMVDALLPAILSTRTQCIYHPQTLTKRPHDT